MAAPAWLESRFMRAARREPVDRVPIWLMRQAGRYLPEYRRIREQVSFLQLCRDPRLAAQAMLVTVERLPVDAAILFSDLLLILEPMGLELRFGPDEGPTLRNPIRDPRDVARFREWEDPDSLDFVWETVRRTRAGLPEEMPLIGFAGAPFTLAAYAIEGRTSRSFENVKRFMYSHPEAWNDLLGKLERSVARYLIAQYEAGAQALQVFDSWVGCLSADDYRSYVLPHTQRLLAALPEGVPVIHFGTGNPALIPLQAEAGGTVIGVDWRIRLSEAWAMIGEDRGIQGNLDPAVLLGPEEVVRRRTREVLAETRGRPGHIFNLGHGVLPSTPVENVLALIETVRDWDPEQLP
ncbi:hypothetical protein JCM17478_08090 [Thermopirellula anaerolimosa]